MKSIHWVSVLFCVVLLSGCTSKTASKTASKTVSTTSTTPISNTTTISTTSTTSSAETTVLLWNNEKKQALAQFMVSWGQTMNQTYTSYDEANSSNYAGLHFPADFDKHTMAVDGDTATMAWSTNGLGEADYNVVAVYCDVEGGNVGGHLYLFAFHEQQPVVLIAEQNQAMPDNRLHFSETKNQELKNGFTQIADTNTASTTETTSSPSPAKAEVANSKLVAAKVWIKQANLTTAAQVDSLMKSLVALDVYSTPSLQIWSTGVTVNKSVTYITATPLAGGMVTYHNNGDGTVIEYPVPTHYQDKNWDDPVKGKQMANEIIDQAQTISIETVSDELAQPLAKFMTGEVN